MVEKMLVTGALSGLGKSIYGKYNCLGLTRKTSYEEREKIKNEGVDIIIHCAVNSSRDINSNNLYGYINDNIFLTRELSDIPHKKFIFISTYGVYPKNLVFHNEEEIIESSDLKNVNLYGISKLMSESVVEARCKDHLILRCSSLLGKNIRKNNLIKVLYDKPCNLTLTKDSTLNCILHSDVLDFIEFAIQNNIQGIYNVVSNENITFSQVADMFNKKVNFGSYQFDVGSVSNKKIIGLFPQFNKSSRQVLEEFVEQIGYKII